MESLRKNSAGGLFLWADGSWLNSAQVYLIWVAGAGLTVLGWMDYCCLHLWIAGVWLMILGEQTADVCISGLLVYD